MGSACAVVMLTYLVSIFVSLTMEAPILTLDQMLFGLFTPNKQKSATVGIGNKVATAQNEPDEKATLNERKINENISVTSMLYEDVIKSAEEAVHI